MLDILLVSGAWTTSVQTSLPGSAQCATTSCMTPRRFASQVLDIDSSDIFRLCQAMLPPHRRLGFCMDIQ